MKIIYQGDIHLRDKTPVNRVDDYVAAEWRKVIQLVRFSNQHGATLLLGGDLLDSYRVPIHIVNLAAVYLEGCVNKIYSVLGQHDVPYHQMDLMQSPVFPLFNAGVITYVGLYKSLEIEPGVLLHFVSWEQAPSKPVPGKFNIFLGHVSVFEGQVPFYWKGEGYTPKTLKEKYPGFDLYLCGDIHQPLVEDNVVVSGSMMRIGIDQIDYRPRCYLIDTDILDIQPLYYDIEPDVFSVHTAKMKTDLQLDDLVAAMKVSALGRESFKRDCLALSEGRGKVKEVIQEIFDGLD